LRPRDPVPLTVRAAEYRASPEMDLIQETPTKRRKTEDGHVSRGRAYDSEDDSGDDLFQGHETVATVPVFNRPFARSHGSLPLSSPPIHVTQPTQIIEKNTPGSSRKPSVIQVAASSPIRPPGTVSPNGAPQRGTGGLASMMAPAGTMFRPPMGVVKPPVIDLSDDDGPVYRGGPSDDESQQVRRNDIKPSTFVQSTKDSRSKVFRARVKHQTSRVLSMTREIEMIAKQHPRLPANVQLMSWLMRMGAQDDRSSNDRQVLLRPSRCMTCPLTASRTSSFASKWSECK